MNFLRALFWIVVTLVVVLFSVNNWIPVTLRLSEGLAADVKLPVLLLVTFLLGFVPLYAWYRTQRWRWERRALVAERALVVPPPIEPTLPVAEPPAAAI